MKLYNVGPDEPYGYEEKDDRYVWLVYWYEIGDYCGDGEAVAFGKDGLVYFYGLGHCSCYGPFDDWGSPGKGMTVEEYLRPKDSVHDLSVKGPVDEKVTKLLKAWKRREARKAKQA